MWGRGIKVKGMAVILCLSVLPYIATPVCSPLNEFVSRNKRELLFVPSSFSVVLSILSERSWSVLVYLLVEHWSSSDLSAVSNLKHQPHTIHNLEFTWQSEWPESCKLSTFFCDFILGLPEELSWILDLDCKSGKNLRDIKSELLIFTCRTQVPRNSSSVVLGHCLRLLVQFWRPYPVFAGLQPVVGDLYPSRLRKQKRGTDHSQPVLKQNQAVLRWPGGLLLTQLSALRGAASPGLTPGASLTGCCIACS